MAPGRIAVAMVGRVQWELIEPLNNTNIDARLLAEKGEGVDHIAVAAANFEETLAAERKRGNELVPIQSQTSVVEDHSLIKA